jgi:hypothetical protein
MDDNMYIGLSYASIKDAQGAILNVLHGPKNWAKVFIGTFMKTLSFELFLIVLLKRTSLIMN